MINTHNRSDESLQSQTADGRLDDLGAFAVRLQSRYREKDRLHVETGDRSLFFFVREACKKVRMSKKTPFSLHIRNHEHAMDGVSHGTVKIEMTKTGQELLRVASSDYRLVRDQYPKYIFSPEYRVFERMFTQVPSHFAREVRTYSVREHKQEAVERMTTTFKRLHRRLLSPAFTKQSENFRRNATKNFNGLLCGMENLASVHDEVQVLFFTLSPFTTDALERHRTGEQTIAFAKDDPEGLHRFMKQRDSFQKAMTAKFGDHRLGYAWTLEHGKYRKYHMHYLLILRKDWPMDDLQTMDWVERTWMKTTGQHGHFHCSNGSKTNQAFLAVGQVRFDDPNVIKGLQCLATYITLGGLFMKLDAGDYDTYGRGGFLTTKAKAVGRPSKRRTGPAILISAREAASHIKFL